MKIHILSAGLFLVSCIALPGCIPLLKPHQIPKMPPPVNDHRLKGSADLQDIESEPLGGFSYKALLAFTEQHSPLVIKARHNLRAKIYAAEAISSGKYPELKGTIETLAGHDGSDEAEISLMLPLFTFGKYDAEVNRGLQQINVAKRQEEVAIYDAKLKLTDLYFDWLLSYEVYKARQEVVAQSNELFQRIQKQVDAGILSENDLTNAELQIDRLDRAALNAEIDLERAESELSFRLKRMINREKLANAVESLPSLPSVDDSIIEEMIGRYPQIYLLREQLRSHQAEIAILNKSDAPVINLVAKKTWDDFTRENSVSNEGIGIAVAFKLSQAGSVGAKLNEQYELIAAKESEIMSVQRDLRVVIQRQKQLIESSKRRMKVLSQSLERSSKSLESSRRQFNSGTESWVAYLNAISQVNEVKLALKEAQLVAETSAARFWLQYPE